MDMTESRAAQLKKMAEEVQNLNTSPLYHYRQANQYSMVFGEGNPQAAILFIGEAPGEQEAKTGRPFVGASGRLLSELLDSIGLQREDVYITNVVKDRPPENRDPTAAEIQLYQPFLLRQIELIQPQVIVTLGRFAMDFILKQFNLSEKGQKISRLHGKLLQAQTAYGQVSVVPLYHPAVALYTRDQAETLKQDFQVLKQFVSPHQ
jgi:DNA polymerase